jgi:Flp pilus assembly protein TadB
MFHVEYYHILNAFIIRNLDKEMKMRPNVGNTERLNRFIIAALGLLLILTETFSGTWMYITAVICILMLITGAIKFCPIYRIIGISTRRKRMNN